MFDYLPSHSIARAYAQVSTYASTRRAANAGELLDFRRRRTLSRHSRDPFRRRLLIGARAAPSRIGRGAVLSSEIWELFGTRPRRSGTSVQHRSVGIAVQRVVTSASTPPQL